MRKERYEVKEETAELRILVMEVKEQEERDGIEEKQEVRCKRRWTR